MNFRVAAGRLSAFYETIPPQIKKTKIAEDVVLWFIAAHISYVWLYPVSILL